MPNATLTDDVLTDSQRARRHRILEVATTLASRGGFEAVHMRDVAERADVALGTLYRYFPSKTHLLVAAMHEQTLLLRQRINRRPAVGDTPEERVADVIVRATEALQREPKLTEAMVRALMMAESSVAPEVERVTAMATSIILDAMRGPEDEVPEEGPAIARVIEQVWMAGLIAWLSGRASATQIHDDLRLAARLLLANR